MGSMDIHSEKFTNSNQSHDSWFQDGIDFLSFPHDIIAKRRKLRARQTPENLAWNAGRFTNTLVLVVSPSCSCCSLLPFYTIFTMSFLPIFFFTFLFWVINLHLWYYDPYFGVESFPKSLSNYYQQLRFHESFCLANFQLQILNWE